MKKIIVALLVTGFLAIASLAMAQGWGKGPGCRMGLGPSADVYGPMGPGAGLNLTAEQIPKMQALQESYFKETMPLRNELMSKQLEMQGLWLQTDLDQEKILAKQKEISALKSQLQEKAIKHRLDVRKILTPEQQAQMGAFPGGRGGWGPGCDMRGGFGRGYGMGMGYGSCPRW